MALYCLDCPCRNAQCRVHYDGTSDGLFLLSNQSAVSLKLLYDSVAAFKGSGLSPHAFCIITAEEYDGAYRASDSPQPFMAENTWRRAFYLFLASIHTNNAMFKCPCCEDNPKILIADGIRLLINASQYKGQDITKPGIDLCVEPPDHKRHDRSFIDQRAGLTRSQSMQGFLVKFAKFIRVAAMPAADEGEGGAAVANDSSMSEQEIDTLIEQAAIYQLDDFLS